MKSQESMWSTDVRAEWLIQFEIFVVWLQKSWTLGKDSFYYFCTEEKKRDDTLPSSELAQQAIEYARELEMIV
jgi:hypothetical protein